MWDFDKGHVLKRIKTWYRRRLAVCPNIKKKKKHLYTKHKMLKYDIVSFRYQKFQY